MRLFVALTLPEAVKDAIERAQAEFRAVLPEEGVRWTKRGQFHLTLKFLGELEPERLEPLKAALLRAGAGFAALELRAEHLGFFPHARAPRVIWAGVQDARGELERLQAAVEAGTRGFTRETPEGNFTGHVTLGRVKNLPRAHLETLSRLAASRIDSFFGAWTAAEIELIQSELSPAGSRHTTLATMPLLPQPH
jgi:RNA 2',3'-cyclic 3'-phosphodiesterase